MQFSTFFLTFAFAARALADTHYNAICTDAATGGYLYNAEATETACGYYFMRNKGTEWWNTCPDCKMVTVNEIPFCNSAAGHIGGDEITYYCQLAGAKYANTS